MRLELAKLQESDNEAQKIKVKKLKNIYKEMDRVLHYQRLLFVLKAIRIKFISQHYNDLLAKHFGIDKIREVISRKYYWSSLRKDIKAYIKCCDICLGLKVVKSKPYSNLQFLPVLTHQ